MTRKGGRYLGLCPFHNEKTPSFTVNPERQSFYCFGCHATGDAFDFVQLFYNLSFREACSWLSQRYGISQDITPAARLEARKAIRQRQVDKQREGFGMGIIKAEYDRLCNLERQIYRIIAGIRTESDLDKPEVIAALQNQAHLENFLDRWLDKDTDDATRYEMALISRGVF